MHGSGSSIMTRIGNFVEVRFIALSILLLCTAASEAQGLFHYYTGLFLPKYDSPRRVDRLFVDVQYATWIDVPEDVELKPWSHGLQIYRLLDIPFGKSNFGFAIGPGLSLYNFHHNAQYNEVIDPITNDVFSEFRPYSDGFEYRKNKLSVNSVELAGELRIRSKPGTVDNKKKKLWRLYLGGKAGWIFNGHSTTIGEDGKYKTYNFNNLNRLQYGVAARLGWHRIMLSANYSMNSLFLKDQGQDLRTLGAGITIYFF